MDEIKEFLDEWSSVIEALGFTLALLVVLNQSRVGQWVRNRWAESSRSRARKRISELELNLRMAEWFSLYPAEMSAYLLSLVFVIFQRLIVIAVLLGVALIIYSTELYKVASRTNLSVVPERDLVSMLFILIAEYGSMFLGASAISLTAKGYQTWVAGSLEKRRAEMRNEIAELKQVVGEEPPPVSGAGGSDVPTPAQLPPGNGRPPDLSTHSAELRERLAASNRREEIVALQGELLMQLNDALKVVYKRVEELSAAREDAEPRPTATDKPTPVVGSAQEITAQQAHGEPATTSPATPIVVAPPGSGIRAQPIGPLSVDSSNRNPELVDGLIRAQEKMLEEMKTLAEDRSNKEQPPVRPDQE